MSTSLWNKLGIVKWRVKETYKNLSYRLSVPWHRSFIRDFWDSQADMIHDHWGNIEHDYQILSKLLDAYKPSSVLDVGCGSGRLFKLYAQHKIQDVIGVDISSKALALANERFPSVSTICGGFEDFEFPQNRFGMAICNRVLQHIPPRAIVGAVAKLCQWSQLIYINELTTSDNLHENFYMARHDYATLFSKWDFALRENGLLKDQTYEVYGRRNVLDKAGDPMLR